ncbi:MAG: hypothetical protein PVJ28_04305 [Acidimicrobiia bacterium]
MSWFTSGSATTSSSGFDLSRLLRRLVVLTFALIQAVLVARILLDLGLFSPDSGFGEFVVTMSNFLAAPVQGIGSGLSGMFGGTGLESIAGEGFNPVMLVALAGWSVVEGLVMRVVRKFDQV